MEKVREMRQEMSSTGKEVMEEKDGERKYNCKRVKELQRELNSDLKGEREWKYQNCEQNWELPPSETRERAENVCAQGVDSPSSRPEDTE